MQIKSILAGAAIALVAGVGAGSAADRFSTLEGIAADALTPQEMGMVTGALAGDLRVMPGSGDATPGEAFGTGGVGAVFTGGGGGGHAHTGNDCACEKGFGVVMFSDIDGLGPGPH